MAVIPKTSITLLGFNIQGDLGPWTCYKNARRGTVVFLRAPPRVPASAWQIDARKRWTAIARLWRAATPQQRTAWKLAASKAKLRTTGYGLFLWHHCHHDYPTLATIEAAADLTLTPR
jgi:hypothetical protein